MEGIKLKLLFDVFSIVQYLFIWTTLVLAILIFEKSVIEITRNRTNLKSWVIVAVSLVYIIVFVCSKLLYPEIFELVTGVIFWIAIITATQFTKYEDRKSRKRWCTQ